MSGAPEGGNAREQQYWNSPATRPWSEHHDVIDRLLAGVTEALLAAAAPSAGESVIDIGCGSGTTVLALAARVGPKGRVIGADISEASVAKARERIAAAGLRNAEVMLADASSHRFAPQSCDLLFSRFGVMFFADPVAAFANFRKAMKPGGRFTATVFRTPKENPWATASIAAWRHLIEPSPPPGPEEPGQFAWADPARVKRILEGGGFREISLTPHDPAMRLAGPGGAEEAANFAMMIGPAVRALTGKPESLRAPVRAALKEFFAKHDGPQGIVFPGAIWLVKAKA